MTMDERTNFCSCWRFIRSVVIVTLMLFSLSVLCDERAGRDYSDMNRDGVVDLEDVNLFWYRYVYLHGKKSSVFNWCEWLVENEKEPEFIGYRRLFAFIYQYEVCAAWTPPDPLAVIHRPQYPTRLALGPLGEIYMTDVKTGSVFIFDPAKSLSSPIAEIKKDVGEPLGICVSSTGDIYVGDSASPCVKQFNVKGELKTRFGMNLIRMPSDLALDEAGNVYVADSQSNVIWVFGRSGKLIRTIRTGDLLFPSSVMIAYVADGIGGQVGELYVGDKDHYLVKVFDLEGNLLRQFGGFPVKSGMLGTSWDWEGKFVAIQDLAITPLGTILVLDGYMLNVQELNSVSGFFIRAFGEAGDDPGQIRLPMDLLILPSGEVLAADAVHHRLEMVEVLP